jgi:hypothetical protein|tara:strand:- start:2068 stop:2325 length:258 start_codon:yes stop_codon:yes gene_type:complete
MNYIGKPTWKKLKAKAPKIPKLTCPSIDHVLHKIEKIKNSNGPITQFQHDVLMKRMEELRVANDGLRECGIYWYEVSKKLHKKIK